MKTLNNLTYSYQLYDEIINNWSNHLEWSGWKESLYIAVNIPGTKQKETPAHKVFRFARNHQIEKEVAKAMDIEFYDDSHLIFHTGWGDKSPDFKDRNNKTYELKTTTKYDYDAEEWWDADVHLYYDIKDQILYEQIPDGSYIAIMEIKMRLIQWKGE